MQLPPSLLLIAAAGCAVLKEAIGAEMIVHRVPLWLGGRMMVYGPILLPFMAVCLTMLYIELSYEPPSDSDKSDPR